MKLTKQDECKSQNPKAVILGSEQAVKDLAKIGISKADVRRY